MTTIAFEVPPQHTDELIDLLKHRNRTAPVSTDVSKPDSTEPAISIETLRQELIKVSQSGKAAQVKTLLAEFGARNLKELKHADFAAVLEKAGSL